MESVEPVTDSVAQMLEALEPIDAAVESVRCAALAESAGTDVAASIGAELREDAAGRLACAVLRLAAFLRRQECQARRAWDPTQQVGRALIEEGRRLLNGALSESAPPPLEPTLRSAYRLIGILGNLAAWSAPATQESHALASFPVAAARDGVAYSRFGGAEIAAQEQAYAAMLGFHPYNARLLLTSSGMTAYALIEAFLLREVLEPNDRIVLHPSVYFEPRRQIASLPQVCVCTAAGGGRDEMLAAIGAYQPRVVFVDPLSNAADFRAVDMMRLLQQADQICRQETWFVVDSTLLSGGFDPFAGPRRRHVRVLYYESGCKYLQFGMDLGPSGLVVVEALLAPCFDQLRRGIGAIGSEALILPRASRRAYLDYLCAQTACAQAAARAALETPEARALDEQVDESLERPASVQLRICESKHQHPSQVRVIVRVRVIRMGILQGMHRFDDARPRAASFERLQCDERRAGRGLRAGSLRAQIIQVRPPRRARQYQSLGADGADAAA